MVKTTDRAWLSDLLDFLADGLRTSKLGLKHKESYYSALKSFSREEITRANKTLYENYRKRSNDDFPPVQAFMEILQSQPKVTEKTHVCFCEGCKKPNVFLHCDFCDKPQCFRCFSCHKHCKCEDGILPFKDSQTYFDLSKACRGLALVIKKGVENGS